MDTLPCYLVEWYGPAMTTDVLQSTAGRLADWAASMTADGAQVRLLMALAVPTDDVAFAAFAADSAQTVAQLCTRAGFPARRITPAVSTGTGIDGM